MTSPRSSARCRRRSSASVYPPRSTPAAGTAPTYHPLPSPLHPAALSLYACGRHLFPHDMYLPRLLPSASPTPTAQCSIFQCSLPVAQCPMPNAQCQMPKCPNARCPLPIAQCPMPNAHPRGPRLTAGARAASLSPRCFGSASVRSSSSAWPSVSSAPPPRSCPSPPAGRPRLKGVILSQQWTASPRTCTRLGCSTRNRSGTAVTPPPVRGYRPWTPPAGWRPLPGYHPWPRTPPPAGARPRARRRSRGLLVAGRRGSRRRGCTRRRRDHAAARRRAAGPAAEGWPAAAAARSSQRRRVHNTIPHRGVSPRSRLSPWSYYRQGAGFWQSSWAVAVSPPTCLRP